MGMVIYLLLPMVIAVLVSFSPTRFIEIPETFSLHWYRVFFNNVKWMNGLWNSLYVGGLTIVISLAVGVMAALAFTRYKLKWGTVLYTLALTPVFTPAVIIGMSLLAFAHTVEIWGTYISIAIAHSLWSYPLVLMILKVSLEGLDPSLAEAARGMGASFLRTFHEITLPLIAPAVLVAVLFSFIISVNEFVMALFLATVETETLPRIIWPTLRYALTPLVAAASGVLMLLTVAVLLVSAQLMNLRKFVEFSRP